MYYGIWIWPISAKTLHHMTATYNFPKNEHFCCGPYKEWNFCKPTISSGGKIPGGSINLSPWTITLGKKCCWQDSKGIKWWQDFLGNYGSLAGRESGWQVFFLSWRPLTWMKPKERTGSLRVAWIISLNTCIKVIASNSFLVVSAWLNLSILLHSHCCNMLWFCKAILSTIYSGTLQSQNVHCFVISDCKVLQHRVIDIVIPMAQSIGHLWKLL